jgi:hypothetical protein
VELLQLPLGHASHLLQATAEPAGNNASVSESLNDRIT